MAIQNHGETSGLRADRRELVLEIVVVLRPAIDVGARTSGRTEAAQVVGMCLDPGLRETRRDMRMPPSVLRDPVDQEKVRASCVGRGPAQGAQLESVTRASCPERALAESRHAATIGGPFSS